MNRSPFAHPDSAPTELQFGVRKITPVRAFCASDGDDASQESSLEDCDGGRGRARIRNGIRLRKQ
jgi:hypothetical protein